MKRINGFKYLKKWEITAVVFLGVSALLYAAYLFHFIFSSLDKGAVVNSSFILVIPLIIFVYTMSRLIARGLKRGYNSIPPQERNFEQKWQLEYAESTAKNLKLLAKMIIVASIVFFIISAVALALLGFLFKSRGI